jgi:hypothetical protein
VVGERATDDGTRAHDHVPSETSPRKDDHPGSEPAPVADAHGNVARPLGVHHGIGIRVAVVLIGHVDVGAGVHVVTDLEVEVPHDVAPPADHAPVADADDRIGDHLLAGHHAGGDAHVRTDQRVRTDADPALAEDGARREGQTAALPEGPEPSGEMIAGPDRPLPADPSPGEVDETVHRAVCPGGRRRPGRPGQPGRPVDLRMAWQWLGTRGVRWPGPRPVDTGWAAGRHAS